MSVIRDALSPVRHGIAMGVLALIFGGLWAGYLATHHERLHGGFEQQEGGKQGGGMEMGMISGGLIPSAHAHGGESHGMGSAAAKGAGAHQHSHSGSLATDAMQRLLRGHIHFMGIGLLTIVILIIVAATELRSCWKRVFGWTLGLGTLLYPPAWILMGFRTVEMGPQAAEASVMWLFGPAVALLIGSLIALFVVLLLEMSGLKSSALFSRFFRDCAS
ncbi:MAG: hypothetical protein Q9M13_03495 [Mariprofundales bacterium]|nr:hypothetical protein [Mariprofundales bacterium]